MVKKALNSLKTRKKTIDISDNEDIAMSSFRDLEKSKHRNCEYRRRQQENVAIDSLRSVMVETKKFKTKNTIKVDRIQLFSSAASFIQENESTMNILLGVLCTAVACHPGVQNKVLRIGEESGIVKRNDILKLFNVPNSAKKHTG